MSETSERSETRKIVSSRGTLVIATERCKGCELCVVVCDAAKHYALEMKAVGGDGKLLKEAGESADLGSAYQ